VGPVFTSKILVKCHFGRRYEWALSLLEERKRQIERTRMLEEEKMNIFKQELALASEEEMERLRKAAVTIQRAIY
jgi:hypothetical protein